MRFSRDRVEFRAEGVEEERADELEDVRFVRVVGAEVVARLFVHHALEHRAEDGGGDFRPVERAAVEERPAHFGGERGHRQRLGEQSAVDVGKRRQRLVEDGEPPFRRRVERLEEGGELLCEVTAVSGGALGNEPRELVGLEDAGVLGEEAEEEADEVDFERVPRVADGLHRVVESGHLLGGPAVHGVLFADFTAVVSDHVAEERHVLAQVLEGELGQRAVVREVVEADACEVAHDDRARDGFAAMCFLPHRTQRAQSFFSFLCVLWVLCG